MTRTRAVSMVAIGATLMFGLACLGIAVPLQGTILLAFGWVLFLGRVIPHVTPDWTSVATGAIALTLLVVGLHFFLCWFHSAIRIAVAAANDGTVAKWRLRSTASIVAIVVMMFVAGISMVGITHEIVWLATSREVIFEAGPRLAVRRMRSSNNLMNLSSGIRDYQVSHYGLSPAATKSEDGLTLHGWQTAILPSLDPDTFKRIDMTQAWDSRRNADAMKRRIAAFQIPDPSLPPKNTAGYALSHYSANVHVLGGKRPIDMYGIADGASNTLLIGEAAGNYRPWGYPHNYRDPMIGMNTSPDGFGSPWPSGAQFAMADGSVKFVTNNIDPQVLRALATPAGGEVVGDW